MSSREFSFYNFESTSLAKPATPFKLHRDGESWLQLLFLFCHPSDFNPPVALVASSLPVDRPSLPSLHEIKQEHIQLNPAAGCVQATRHAISCPQWCSHQWPDLHAVVRSHPAHVQKLHSTRLVKIHHVKKDMFRRM